MDIIRSIPQLEALRDEWPTAPAHTGSPLLDHAWIACSARTLHDESAIRVVTIRRGGVLIGVAPLAAEPSRLGTRLVFIGASTLHEPCGWLTGCDADLDELASAIIETGHSTLLQRVAVNSGVGRAMLAQPRFRVLSMGRAARPSLAVAITGTWDDYRKRLSTRITQNLPRIRRRAERTAGRFQFELLAPRVSEVDEVLDGFVEVENSGWKGRQGSSLRHRPRLQAFFRAYAREAAERAELRVARLRIGSTLAAVELAVEAHARVWQLKIGYAEAVAEFYPGLQLTEFSIRSAFERGLRSYEFLGSAESWEERWRPERREYQHIISYPVTPRGLCRVVGDLGAVVWARAGGGR